MTTLRLNRRDLARQFRGTAPAKVVVAALAGLPPEPAWDGCALALCDAAAADHKDAAADVVFVQVRAPDPLDTLIAARLTERLATLGLTATSAPARQNGGVTLLCEARDGRWVTPGEPTGS